MTQSCSFINNCSELMNQDRVVAFRELKNIPTDDCDRKCFNQLFTGEIYANMNKKSSNLTAFCSNLFNEHTNPYEFMNCIACSSSSKNQFVPRDTIKVNKTTACITFLNVSHCQIIVLSTKHCWLSIRTGGNPRLSTTLTQRVMSPLLGDLVYVGEAIVLNSLLYVKLKERLWEGTELDLTEILLWLIDLN